MKTEKKKIVINTDFCRAKTGFGRSAKELLKYLYSTGKYEIVEYACGIPVGSELLASSPWKAIGTVPPNKDEYDRIVKGVPATRALVNYGHLFVDAVIEQEKPDLFIGINDIWAFDALTEKPWWGKTKTIVHSTIDSLPVLDMAFKMTERCDKFLVWATFAEKEMRRTGTKNIGTVHGMIDIKSFYRQSNESRNSLRDKFNIAYNAEIIGFVFRNQLRKSVPNLLEAFSRIQIDRPNSYLLLHTCMSEPDGWNIPKLIEQYGVQKDRVLVSYVCRECGELHVRSFIGEDVKCPYCGSEQGMITVRPAFGVREDQLNDVYNLMDVYCHPFTSGGQEMPLQEAKATELITLCPDYSCGSDSCEDWQGGIKLDWEPYYEPASNFKKASTLPSSIIEKINLVLDMSRDEKEKIGKIARKYVIENYCPAAIGKIWEEIIDGVLSTDVKKTISGNSFDFDYEPPSNLSNEEWAQNILVNLCGVPAGETKNCGLKDMITDLSRGVPRDRIIDSIKKNIEKKTGLKIDDKKEDWTSLLDSDDKGRRIAVVLPESAGDVFMSTALLKNLSKTYRNHNIYFVTKPAFFDVLKGNPYVHKVIPYSEQFDNQLYLVGAGEHEGFFELAFLLHIDTQRILNYLGNGKFKTQFQLT